MNKAILIIDMPSSCDMCNFIDGQYHYCNVPWFGKDVSDYVACRHEDCPLRELPSKMQICGKYPSKERLPPSYKIGWNDCIDAFLKGEEHETN